MKPVKLRFFKKKLCMPNNPPPLNSPLPPGGGEKLSIEVITMSNEDYIDFPCSDLWLGYYHDKGLTPRNPQEDYLMKKIERLERQNKQLFYLVAERLQKESKEIKQITDQKIKALERS